MDLNKKVAMFDRNKTVIQQLIREFGSDILPDHAHTRSPEKVDEANKDISVLGLS